MVGVEMGEHNVLHVIRVATECSESCCSSLIDGSGRVQYPSDERTGASCFVNVLSAERRVNERQAIARLDEEDLVEPLDSSPGRRLGSENRPWASHHRPAAGARTNPTCREASVHPHDADAPVR